MDILEARYEGKFNGNVAFFRFPPEGVVVHVVTDADDVDIPEGYECGVEFDDKESFAVYTKNGTLVAFRKNEEGYARWRVLLTLDENGDPVSGATRVAGDIFISHAPEMLDASGPVTPDVVPHLGGYMVTATNDSGGNLIHLDDGDSLEFLFPSPVMLTFLELDNGLGTTVSEWELQYFDGSGWVTHDIIPVSPPSNELVWN